MLTRTGIRSYSISEARKFQLRNEAAGRRIPTPFLQRIRYDTARG